MITNHVRRAAVAPRVTVALLAASAAASLAPGEASAGEYVIGNCDVRAANPSSMLAPNNDPGPWRAYSAVMGAGGSDLQCGPNDPLRIYGLALSASSGTGFNVDTSQIPAITIKRLRVAWTGYVEASGSMTLGTINAHYGEPGHWQASQVLSVRTPFFRADDRSFGAGNRRVGVQVECTTSASTHCNYRHNYDPIIDIHGSEVTLSESVEPTGEATGGALLAGGAQAGVRNVSYQVSDGESGVRGLKVLLGTTEVASADLSSGCTWTDLRACSPSRTGAVSVDTRRVSDGRHDLRFEVTDAAGNTSTRTVADDVQVDNVPDEGPSSVVVPQPGPTGAPGPAGRDGAPGTDGRDGASRPGTANGENASAGARLTAVFSTRQRSMRVRYGTRAVVTGQLVAPTGRPIVGARLDVLTQAKVAGASMSPVGQVTSDAQGRFRYLAPVGVSRTLRFAYKAQLEDTAFAAQEDVELGVVATVTLKVSKTALRNGQTVTFTGRVPGAPRGSRKVVELQVRKGSRWMTFRSTRLSSGTFRSAYRFTRTRGVKRYDFRARVRSEDGFPLLTGHSRAARVTVRG